MVWANFDEFQFEPCEDTRKYLEVHFDCHNGTTRGNQATHHQLIRAFSFAGTWQIVVVVVVVVQGSLLMLELLQRTFSHYRE